MKLLIINKNLLKLKQSFYLNLLITFLYKCLNLNNLISFFNYYNQFNFDKTLDSYPLNTDSGILNDDSDGEY